MLLSNWTKNKKNRYFEAANGGEWQRPVKRKIQPKMKLHYEYYSPHSVKTLNVKLDRKQHFVNGKWERIRGRNVAAYFAFIFFIICLLVQCIAMQLHVSPLFTSSSFLVAPYFSVAKSFKRFSCSEFQIQPWLRTRKIGE